MLEDILAENDYIICFSFDYEVENSRISELAWCTYSIKDVEENLKLQENCHTITAENTLSKVMSSFT